jgi:hypothetical protein
MKATLRVVFRLVLQLRQPRTPLSGWMLTHPHERQVHLDLRLAVMA